MNSIPRPEYLRPQCVRADWLCLNGEWDFAWDDDDRDRCDQSLAQRITVPFCPESPLSGIGDPAHHFGAWYRRPVVVTATWAGRRVLLHFQAVDYDATVWVNGREVGRHRGGFTPFTCDLGEMAGQTITIVVRARDDHRQRKPMGKQSAEDENKGCHYTRTTGIWQTVWLEPVPKLHLLRPRITPDFFAGTITVETPLSLYRAGYIVEATLGGVTAKAETGTALVPRLVLPAKRAWSPEDPFLYDLDLVLRDKAGKEVDRVHGYSHPAILGWCPLNETKIWPSDQTDAFDDLTRALFHATRLADATRPVIDASGWTHRVAESDVYDIHCYHQDPAKLAAHVTARLGGSTDSPHGTGRDDIPYDGRKQRPFFVSEFGGIWCNPDVKPGEASWGYGDRERDIEEFYQRFTGLCAVLLDNPAVAGYCYTQLTDVFQEQNGLYHFDRTPKFDAARLRTAQLRDNK